MTVKVGLDLGYANFTVSDVTAGICREPSVALVSQNTHELLAIGNQLADDAKEGAEGAEGGIYVRPFKNGMLYSSDLTGAIIRRVMKVFLVGDNKVRCFVGIPADFLPKQTAALLEMVTEAGAAEAFAVQRGMAALIGAGYSPSISAVSVNVGASATEILVLHKGEVLSSASAPIGGEDFDQAVKKYVYDQGDFNVSLQVARSIKEKLGAVWEGRPNESLTIEGTLSLTGNRVRMELSTEDILGVFREPLTKLIGAIAGEVKKIPADAVEAIFSNGIILTGGGADLFGLDKMIDKVLGIRVSCPQNPIDCVARGLSRIGTFLPLRVRSGKDITENLSKYYETRNQEN